MPSTPNRRCFRVLWLCLAAPVMVAQASGQSTAALQAAVAQAGGRVIVTLKSTRVLANPALMAPGSPAVSADELQQISSRIGTSYAVPVLRALPATSMIVASIQPAQVAGLLTDPNIAAIEADRFWFAADVPATARDTKRPRVTTADRWAAYRTPARADNVPWGVSQVTAPTVWASGNKGDGIKVGILDSGGDASHPDLAYAGGYDAISGNSINWSDDVGSCNGHGTHIAGTIAAKDDGSGVVGVAPHVLLYAMKVFQDVGGQCGAYTSSQIAGLNWAVSQGIRLVNVSIAGSVSFAYDAAMQSAAAAGTYVFAAAGNAGGAVTYPGSSPYAFGIGALDDTNNRASFSDFGPELDFSAPGVNIYSTMPGGAYGYKSGTSMATPHAVGVAALILANNPSLTFDQLRQKLIDGALDVDAAGFDNNTGYGLLRAANSIAGGGGAPSVTLAVAPHSRNVSVQSGTAAPSDNAAITFSGSGAGSATWTASKRHNWTTLTVSSGTGNGTVSWNRSSAGLGYGLWVDTITISSTGATGSPTFIIDSMTITPPPSPLALALSPSSRSTTVQQGGSASGSSGTVTLSGTGASSAAWTATKRKSWTTLTTASGTGSGTVAWSRNASGLAVGTWVDTITVTAAGATGSPGTIIDTVIVTAAPPPLTLAVAPGSRIVSVQQGSAAPGDNATVTLAGTGASSAAWSATKRKSWTTLTTASGTGSGSVAWSRNTSGLGVGTWVDTITVTAIGASGSPTVVYDSVVISAAPPPLTLAVNPGSRIVTVQQGGTAPAASATVTLTGTGASSTAWTATKRKSWTTLTTASGTGSGSVAWSRNASGLGVGTWVDTISVVATGAVGSPAVVYDTLIISAAPAPLALSLSPGSRRASVQQGSAAPGDTATVTLTGTGASTAVWWGSHRRSYSTVTSGNGSGGGVGSGLLTWTRNATGLAPGVYVDTLGVAVAGGSGLTAFLVDTLTITAGSTPLALALAPTARAVTVAQGSSAPADNATVTLSGTGASSAVWWGSHRQPWTTITSGNGSGGGVGSGLLTWTRNISGMLPGTYVDTLGVAVAGGSGLTAVVYDTITITGSANPIVLAVSPGSRRATVQAGIAAPGDMALVSLTGTGAASTSWSATRRKSWTTLVSSAGTGSGQVTWNRNSTGLAVGTYVDTITVAASGGQGSPSSIIDTMVITAAPSPLTIGVLPGSRSITVEQGTAAPGDVATVSFSGAGAGTAPWTASHRKSWTVLTTASGEGSSLLTWNRNSSGLAIGVYVDTITVVSPGATGSPASIIDTMRVTAVATPVTIAIAPLARSVTVLQGTSAPGDNAVVTLTGDGATSTAWAASARRSWTVLQASAGVGSGSIAWSRNAAGLSAGVYVDTITVAFNGGSARLVDTLRVQAIASVAVNPRGRHYRLLQQSGSAQVVGPVVDSARVQGQVVDGQSDLWTATVGSSWLQLTTPSGHLNGWVRWQRLPAQAGAGMHVDTLRLALESSPLTATIYVDTLEVVSVAAPTPNAAVDDLFRSGAISTDQRTLLDRDGNNNGRYDLGDFLAWVDHNHIHLSASLMTRVQGLMKAQVAPPVKSGGG